MSFLADQVKSMTHFPKERIIVIPLGTENRSEIAVSKKEARGYYNVPEDAFVFGILGRLDPLKGQDLLIKAISGIENKLQKVHVLIVGESTLHEGTAYEDSLKKLTSDLV